jgi:NAD(P)-dependent dehydrogenase (short-subunit alcohol dehydrogenase family)
MLSTKVSLVTGGGSGIGRASAFAFAQAGARVVVSDVDGDGGHKTVKHIREGGGEACFVAADVTHADQVRALIVDTVQKYGRLDWAHNNAGVGGASGQTHEHTEQDWDRTLAVNLKGVWLCMKHEIQQMLDQGSGAIVNTASVAGLVGGFGPAYTASKFGVVGLTKTAALEYARRGIRVNAVCPGAIRTPLLERAFATWPGTEVGLLALEPIGRFGTAHEVAAAVVWLCSDAASFVTGVALPVDGGMVAR